MTNITAPMRALSIVVLCTVALVGITLMQGSSSAVNAAQEDDSATLATAVFAGGCFWCMESDFDKLDGVIDVVSGYSGGNADTATYKQVSYEETGHYEVVEVSYDSARVSYAELLEYYWLKVDPTDSQGQFCDKGSSYKTAIFYASEEEKAVIDASLAKLKKNKPFSEPIVTDILATKPFYAAEPRHQNYYQRNPVRYKFYRNGCGRDRRLKELWGK